MSTAARQLAPFLTIHPFPTPTLYLLLVLVRRLVTDYGITEVIPELDALVERTITQSRLERSGRVRPSPEQVHRTDVLRRQIAPHLLHLQRRLDQHRAHPGIEALRQKVFPHGLGQMVGLPSLELVRAVESVLATLSDPMHRPYVETAGLTTVLRSLAHDHHALRAALRRIPGPPTSRAADANVDLHEALGLLWVRLMAAVWSEHPRHVACRRQLLQIWERCARHRSRRRRSSAPPTLQLGEPPPVVPRTPMQMRRECG